MPILPVLDLKHGQIVRGIAGERAVYRPIVSQLVPSAEPSAVAEAFRAHFGFTEFYLADLDGIQDRQPSLAIYDQLQSRGHRLWIDAGVRTWRDQILRSLFDADVAGIIVGLESVEGPDELEQIVQRIGPELAVFSLDLKAGKPLGRVDLWHTDDPWRIAETAILAMGICRVIVLDLTRVGVGEGVGTEMFCARLKDAFPHVQITAGGGVRGPEDVQGLYAHGVDYVLVASALHDGRLTRADLACLQ